MDPTATLLMLLNALKDEDRNEAIKSLLALYSWLTGEGFFPETVKATEEFLENVDDTEDEEDEPG